ncbi:hypothetical protein, partial [Xenorhabdus bovienii]|uniref:hypothetical protein n=1 Tax=Xenorhabdus bovienii TaxID=40576 RepID=UPI0023B2DB60
MSIINDGHYFPRIRGIPIDGLNEPLTVNGDLKAEILHVQTTQVTDREAFAEDMKKVQADVGENAAAVKTKATVVFDIDGNGYALKEIEAG